MNRSNYFPLYRERRVGLRSADATDALGWRTTQVTKRLAIDELNKSIRDGSMVLSDRETIAEMRTFTRDSNGRMSGSPHDDRVMSLAICNQGTKYVFLRKYQPEKTMKVGSMDWHMRNVDQPEVQKATFVGSDAF